MKRRLAFFIGWVAVALTSGHASGAPAVLRWNNGEALSGEIVEASSSDVTWKTPLFADALQLRWSALRRIDQSLPAVATADPFSIRLRDGSHIYGSLMSITDSTVSIQSARHGDAVLKRSEVLSVRRIRGGNLVFAGPEGDVGWKAVTRGNQNANVRGTTPASPSEVPVIASGPAGALMMPYWNRGASLGLPMPTRVDLEFRVESSDRPDFLLQLGADSKKSLSIETWDNDRVLKGDGQFKLIRKAADDEREVSLRICWDTTTGKCSVYTPGGELLAEWQQPEISANAVPGLEAPGTLTLVPGRGAMNNLTLTGRGTFVLGPPIVPGITLQNKGRDLTLEFLRVRTWNGMPPPKVDLKQARVELDDGRILEGNVTAASAESIQFRAIGRDSDESIPLGDVDAVIFSTDAPQITDHEATLSYADGTLLAGKISSIKDGSAAIVTSFTETPLSSRTDALRQLRLHVPPPPNSAPEPPFAELDKIVLKQETMHGRLTSGGDNCQHWLPVGGVRPATPAQGMPSEITRAFPPDAKIPDAPALFYTSAGDVLPGKLRSIDRSGVEFESSLVEVTKLPAEAIDAVQLRPAARISLQSFSDPGWQILKGNAESVQRTNGSLEMTPGSVIGHPTAMQCSEIRFSVVSPNFSSFRLRLFCDGLDGTKSHNLLLLRTGFQFISSLESTEGQFANQIQTRVSSSEPVPVRLVIDDHSVELYVYDDMIQKFPIMASARAGVGLIIEPAGAWGNEINPISLAGFSGTSEPGRTWLPAVTQETKKQALTVPRFRRDDPPRHALLASNGDVLRGEIEASTGTHFGFRSGLENLRVPVDRVKAVIWLKKPLADATPSPTASPTLKKLAQKITRNIRYTQAGLSVQIAFLKREAPELRFKLPELSDTRTFPMQFGGNTIGDALNQICSSFGLRYRIDGEGEIVLEPAPQVQGDLVEKAYWLKPDALPSVGSAREMLAAKGISFPTGATATWQPKGALLQMTNTAASHEKLAKLLATDFGGSLGSPTHWLLLTNGARLGLAVDSFDNGFVSGHHPVYGRCKAPMSEIYAIRTSMPEPAAITASLKDWRLVYAPEPVLPGSGGQNSPALGKMAATFKLPLLGGGEFDLAQEKGKIVVLDFWATWCGPCVQSLPGLIEAMSGFPSDRVMLIGVNQAEPGDQVRRFLNTRGWKLTVAMDASQSVARQYGVDGIPHTIIVGPDGKVAWVKTGYSPDGDTEASNAVKQLLAPAPAADAPAKPPAP